MIHFSFTGASPSLVGSNASALPAQPANLLPIMQKSSNGLSNVMLAVILVIVGLCVAGLLLVFLIFYYRRRAKRVNEHAKAVQELAYVEDDLKAGQLEKGLP
jgi:heme/copper-type cytochrome/quinol oxidase subunit 2